MMRKTQYRPGGLTSSRVSTLISFVATIAALSLSFSATAGNDPSIKGDLRSNIKTSMNQFIKGQTINSTMYVYDAIEGRMHKLKLDALHEGIVKKNGFYVSCADFKDQNGRKFDIDFLVRPSGSALITTQAIVHSVDGKKRTYHLESL